MEAKSNTNGKKNTRSVLSLGANGLKDSMQQLDAIFKASSDIIYLKDIEGRYTQVNAACAATFGLNVDEIIGKTDFDILPVDIAQHITQDIDLKVFEKGETVHVEDTRPVGGKVLAFDVIEVPIRDTAGKVIGLCGIGRDITERKRAEEELDKHGEHIKELARKRTKELEKAGRHLRNETDNHIDMMQGLDTENASLRAMVESTNHFIMRIRLNPVFKFEYVSPQVTKITGYTPEDFYADSFINLKRLHPDDLPVFKNVQRVFYTPITLRWIHKNGSTIWCEEVSTPFYDKSGNVIGIQVIARDVTEQKKADSELQESRELYQVLLKSINDVIMLFYLKANGLPGKMIEVNEAACRRLGYSKDELLKTDVLKLFAGGTEEWSPVSPVAKTLHNRQRAVFDSTLIPRNGDRLHVEVSAYLFKFRNKSAVLSISHDISNHKDRQIKKKRAQIESL